MGAAALAVTALGAQVGGELTKAKGQAEGYAHQEAQSQAKARAARTAADETDAALREELATALGNIAAIRAAAGTDMSSPTAQAIVAEETRVSDRQRRIKVGNLTSQATQSERDASYYRSAQSTAMSTGYLSAIGVGAKGISGLVTSFGKA
jgi:hypothetical protein